MKGGTFMTQNQISYFKAVEDKRHNEQMERETARANRQSERLTARGQDITAAHNVATEGLEGAKIMETNRNNLVMEQLQARKVAADAALSYATVGLRNAETVLRGAQKEEAEASAVLKTAQKGQAIKNAELLDAQKYTEEFKYEQIASQINKTEKEAALLEKDYDWYTANKILNNLGGILRGAGAVMPR